eukprot:NODE_715_length_4508_cov_0.874121.p2 type:complete len:255 gc:universal NODE_715_length_4508_cov_0.874121:3849-3085(-)
MSTPNSQVANTNNQNTASNPPSPPANPPSNPPSNPPANPPTNPPVKIATQNTPVTQNSQKPDLTNNPPKQPFFLPLATSNSDNKGTTSPPSSTTTTQGNTPAQPPLNPTSNSQTSTSNNPPNNPTNNPTNNPSNISPPTSNPPAQQNLIQPSSNQPVLSETQQTPIIPPNAPILSEKPKGDVIVQTPSQAIQNKDPSKTVEYFVSYALTQTVMDDKTTSVYKTQTFAAIRPINQKADGFQLQPSLLLLLLLFLK